jgi:hypothetical protein
MTPGSTSSVVSSVAPKLIDRAAVAGALQNFVGDERHGFRVVELDAARPALAGKLGGGEDPRRSISVGVSSMQTSLVVG